MGRWRSRSRRVEEYDQEDGGVGAGGDLPRPGQTEGDVGHESGQGGQHGGGGVSEQVSGGGVSDRVTVIEG